MPGQLAAVGEDLAQIAPHPLLVVVRRDGLQHRLPDRPPPRRRHGRRHRGTGEGSRGSEPSGFARGVGGGGGEASGAQEREEEEEGGRRLKLGIGGSGGDGVRAGTAAAGRGRQLELEVGEAGGCCRVFYVRRPSAPRLRPPLLLLLELECYK